MFTDKDKTTYKSTYQILKEISEIYHDLTDKEQAELLEKLAGKRGGQVLAGLLNDFSSVDKALQTMEEAGGAADAEMSIITDSIDHKLNKLKQTWVGVLQSLMNRDDVKGLIDALTHLSEALAVVIDKLGVGGLAGLFIGGNLIKGLKTGESIVFSFVKAIQEMGKESTILEKLFTFGDVFGGEWKGLDQLLGKTSELAEANTILTTTNIKVAESEQAKAAAQEESAITSATETSAEVVETEVTEQNALANQSSAYAEMMESKAELASASSSTAETSAEVAEKIASTGASAASAASGVGALSTAFAGLGGTLATLGIGALIAGAIFLVYKLADALILTKEEAEEMATTAKSNISELKTEIDSMNSTVKESGKRYAELAQGVDQVSGKNISLSNEEYEEFLSISNQLSSVFPTLTSHYDENGNAILNLNGDVSTIVNSLNDLYEAQERIKTQEILKNFEDTLPDYKNKIKDARSQIESLEEQVNVENRRLKDLQNTQERIALTDFFKPNTTGVRLQLGEYSNASAIQQEIDKYIKENKLNVNLTYNPNSIDFVNNASEDYKQLIEALPMITEKVISEFDNSLVTEMQKAKNELQGIYSEISPYLTLWMNQQDFFKDAPEELKTIMSQSISNGDFFDGLIANNVDMSDMSAITNYIKNTYFKGVEELSNDSKIKNAMSKLLTPEIDYESMRNALQEIADYCKTNGIEVPVFIQSQLDDTKEENKIMRQHNAKIVTGNSNALKRSDYSDEEWADYEKIRDYTSKLSLEERQNWEKVTEGIRGADAAIRTYQSHVKEASQDVNESLYEASLEDLGIDETEFNQYVKTLQEVDKELANDADAAKRTAKINLSYSKAVEDLTANLEDYKNILDQANTDNSIKTTKEYSDAISALAKDLSLITGKNFSITDAEMFAYDTNRMAKLEAAINGDKQALQDLRTEALKEVYANVDVEAAFNTDDFNDSYNEFTSWLADNSYLGTLTATAGLDDTVFIQQLNDALHKGATTAQEISSFFDNLGWDVTYKYENASAIRSVPGVGFVDKTGKSSDTYGALGGTHANMQIIKSIAYIRRKSGNVTPSTPKTTDSKTGSGNSGGGGGGGGSSDEKEFKESVDWIEIAISRVQRAIEKLKNIAGNVWQNWTSRANALNEAISTTRKEMELQTQAYAKYLSLADAVDLPENYKQLVREGMIDVEDVTDETLKNGIDQYKDYYEKAINAADAVDTLRSSLYELREQQFSTTEALYNARIEYVSKPWEAVDKEWSSIQSRKKISNGDIQNYYAQRQNVLQANLQDTEEEIGQLQAILNEGLANGEIEYGSQAWYELTNRIQDAKNSAVEFRTEIDENLAKVFMDQFDNIQKVFDFAIGQMDHYKSEIESLSATAEAEGYMASKVWYQSRTEIESNNLKLLEQQYGILKQSLENALSSGAIQEGSEDWRTMKNSIQDVEGSIYDAKQALAEYAQEMRQIDWDFFDTQQDFVSEMTDEANFLIDLLTTENKLIEENGDFNRFGMSAAGLHAINYNTYMAQSKDYAEEIKKINRELANDPADIDLLQRRKELLATQRDMISATEDEKEAIRSLIKEAYDQFLSNLQKIINKRKEALRSIKDLYDYEKNVSEQAKTINDLQKQLLSLTGDDSEEAKNKRQSLTEDLRKAKDTLEETEYDKWISDQEELMDKLYDEFEELINERLDNIDLLVHEVIDMTNANAATIGNTIVSSANEVGYVMTDGMNNVMNNMIAAGNAEGNATREVIVSFQNSVNSNFTAVQVSIDGVKGKLQELRNTADQISSKLTESINQQARIAAQQAQTQAQSQAAAQAASHSSVASQTNTGNSNASTAKANNYSELHDAFLRSISNSYYGDWNMRTLYEMYMSGQPLPPGTDFIKELEPDWMKRYGAFAKGGTIGSLIKRTGEDGFILARTGEEVLSLDKIRELTGALSILDHITSGNTLNPGSIARTTFDTNNNINASLEFNLPNVKDGNDFIKFLQTDKAQKIIQESTLGQALGKSKLRRYTV